MADINDLMNQLSQLGAAVQNTAGTINAAGGRTGAGIQAVGQNMARLRTEMQRGTGSVADYAQQLRRVSAQYNNLTDSLKSSDAGQRIFAEQSRASSQLIRQTMGEFAGAVAKTGVTQALEYFKNQFFTTIKSLQDNVGGTAAAFALTNNALNAQIKTLEQLQSSLESATGVLALMPGYGKAAAAVTALGSVLAGLGKDLTKLQAEGVQVLQTEIVKSEIAFNAMTASGAQFTGGMQEMRRATAAVRLDLAELSKFVAQNNETLAKFGGTVQGGINRFSSVSAEMGNFRKELVMLGYSYEDQAQGMADYMQMMQQAGQLQQMTDAQLAKGSRDYLFNLRAISALTGEDVKRAQARAREASTQLAVQSKLQNMGAGAMERFQAGIMNMEPFMQKALQEATAFDGTVVDQGLNQLFAMSPAREELFRRSQQNMQDLSLDATEITRRYQADVRELGPAMAKEAGSLGDSLGAANLAIGSFPELTRMVEATMQLGLKGQSDFNSRLPDVVRITGELATSQDALRQTTADVQVAFKNYQAQLIEALTEEAEYYALEGARGLPGFLANKGMMKQLDDGFGVTIAGLSTLGITLKNIPESINKAATEIEKNARNFLLDVFRGGLTTPRRNQQTPDTSRAPNVDQNASEYARGGVLRGPDSGFQSSATFHGHEAVIPLGSGDTIAVDLRSPSGLIESAIQKAQAQAGIGNKSMETMQTTLQTMFDNPNLLTRSMGELKQQVASDNQMSQSLLNQYTDKMDTLIATLQDNVEYSRRIANDIS
jgi:hypothetical protein